MNTLIKLMLLFLLIVIGTVISIWVLIYGWGLEPQNWVVIFAGLVWSGISLIITAVVSASSGDDLK